MDVKNFSKELIGILIGVMFLVILLPMINEQITTATTTGGSLENVAGVALLIALPSFIILGSVGSIVYKVVKA